MLSFQLFYFLGVVFLLAGTSAPDAPVLPWHQALPLCAMGCGLYVFVVRRVFAAARSAEDWLKAERRAFALAFAVFLALLYGLDLRWYLRPLDCGGRFESLADLTGLALFFGLLCPAWLAGWRRYGKLFGEVLGRVAFLKRQCRQNLALVLPWALIVVALDLLRLLLPENVRGLVPEPWSELLVFAFFAALLLFALPPLIIRLWDCRPLPEGPLADFIAAFCRDQRFPAVIRLWPQPGGLTAGILGAAPPLRYLLFTPSLLALLGPDELKAVIAHEIGHVRRHHLLWYMALFFGFSLALLRLAPLLDLALQGLPSAPGAFAEALISLPALAIVLLWFRFVFGFFLRNFERQADAHALTALGIETGAEALIRSFHRLGLARGGGPEKRNWHHFSLKERVDFLVRCRARPELLTAHDHKVRRALVAYFAVCAALAALPVAL